MKNPILVLALLAGTSLATSPANASAIQDALKNREDLSNFYSALVDTGVINELTGSRYTVFAPTNEAFARISREKYPCFYSPACKDDLADVLRNHFVSGEYGLEGKNSLFSIDKRQLILGEPTPGKYTVNGNNVTSEYQMLGSMLYKVDGVIADDSELAQFRNPPAGQEVVVERKIYRAPDGRPDGMSETTVITAPAPSR